MLIPAIAEPVAVDLMPLIPLIPVMTSPFDIVMTSPFDIVITAPAPIDIPLMPAPMEEPEPGVAPAVGSLSHIMVITGALEPDGVGVAEGAVVMRDCASARGAAARSVAAKKVACILM